MKMLNCFSLRRREWRAPAGFIATSGTTATCKTGCGRLSIRRTTWETESSANDIPVDVKPSVKHSAWANLDLSKPSPSSEHHRSKERVPVPARQAVAEKCSFTVMHGVMRLGPRSQGVSGQIRREAPRSGAVIKRNSSAGLLTSLASPVLLAVNILLITLALELLISLYY